VADTTPINPPADLVDAMREALRDVPVDLAEPLEGDVSALRETDGSAPEPNPTEGFDAYDAQFEAEPGVGLTIHPNRATPWLTWGETKDLAAWLAKVVEEGDGG
jgi:hypothetical protein